MGALTERDMTHGVTEVDSEEVMRLSEDLADDVNNALHAIRLSAEMLRRNRDDGPELEAAVSRIEAIVDRTELSISVACMKLHRLSEQIRRAVQNGG